MNDLALTELLTYCTSRFYYFFFFYFTKGPCWKQVVKLLQAILIPVVYNFDCIIAVIE